ncbi:hypothetical protein A4A49_57718, partial [Nicotiana attenuata]
MFTEEQFNQILKLLNKDEMQETTANMAGISHSTVCLVDKGGCTHEWIIDTGATDHMTSNFSSLFELYNITSQDGKTVQLPNGTKATVSHIGKCKIGEGQEIKNVLYIPDFKYSLLSVSKLTRELRCMAAFFPGFCVLQDLFTGKLKGIVIGDKFQPRAVRSVLMGYSVVQKGYLLFDLTHKRFFVSRNVTFRESVFPFKYLQTAGPVMFQADPYLITQAVPTATISDPAPTTTTDPQLDDQSTGQEAIMEDLHSGEASSSGLEDISPAIASEDVDMPGNANMDQDVVTIDHNHEAVAVPLRKSARDKGPPLWLHDYVT